MIALLWFPHEGGCVKFIYRPKEFAIWVMGLASMFVFPGLSVFPLRKTVLYHRQLLIGVLHHILKATQNPDLLQLSPIPTKL